MNFVRVLPVLLSAALIAAHFLRSGMLTVAAVCVMFPAVLLVRHPLAPRIIQAGLVLAGVEWLRSLVVIAAQRRAAGQPWARMALILGGVAVLAFAATLVFRSPALARHYSRTADADGGGRTQG